MGTKVTLLGASGYAGAELVRLVSGHPAMELVALGAYERAGRQVGQVLPHLVGCPLPDIETIETAASMDADVCFACMPSAPPDDVSAPVVIDLSDSRRATPGWIYGLTEFARPTLRGANRIANPGCYSTAALLALVPLARAGLIEGPFIVDAISGVTGAGRRLEERLMFSAVDGGAAAYGTTAHRHVPEIEGALRTFGDTDGVVSFTPHLVPMKRGIVVTARGLVTRDVADDDPVRVLQDAYLHEPFVNVTEDWPHSAHVVGTNRAEVSARIDERAGMVVASAAIDNLGKGAAGQALQNANVAMGYDETLGLTGTALWP